MRLLKKPKQQEPVKEPTKATIVATYTNGDEQNTKKVKDYQLQSVDGFIEKIKLCIGKPNYFQNLNSIFNSRVKGVTYSVFANVCKTPTSEMVVGVKIVDVILGNTLEITGSNFTKDDGVLEFFDKCHMIHVAQNIIKENPQ